MRFDAVLASVLYSSALFLGQVRSHDEVDDLEPSAVAAEESTAAAPIQKATFTVSLLPS